MRTYCFSPSTGSDEAGPDKAQTPSCIHILPHRKPEAQRSPAFVSTARVIGIVGVFLYHALTMVYGPAWGHFDAALARFPAALQPLVQTIFTAVSHLNEFVGIFFIVSGYFVHRAFQRSCITYPNRPLRTFVKFFVWRRFWRLVPPFWAALLFSYFVSFDHPLSWNGLRKLIVNASLLKTLYPGYFFTINYAHWYVAVQWQIDLLYPLFLYIILRRSVPFAVALAWIASFFLTFVAPQFTAAPYILYLPFRWWAEWSAGVFLQERHSSGVRVFRWPYATMLGATVVMSLGYAKGLDPLQWFGSRLLLASVFEAVLLSQTPRLAIERFAAPIGICSYSIYLFHIPILQLVHREFEALGADFSNLITWSIFAAISAVASFAIAWLSAQYIERKSSSLGNRLWRRRFILRFKARARLARMSNGGKVLQNT